MALESTEVRVAGTGQLFVAPSGTTIPASTASPLSHALGWIDLGYATEDGVTFNFGREANDIPAWQSFDPVRTVITAKPKTVSASLMQSNQHVMLLALGGGTVTETATGYYRYDPPVDSFVDERMFAVEFVDGSYTYRIVYRKAINEGGVEFTWTKGEAIVYPITMKVLAADAGAKPFSLYTDDPNVGLLTSAAS